jgi:hypothetical protein
LGISGPPAALKVAKIRQLVNFSVSQVSLSKMTRTANLALLLLPDELVREFALTLTRCLATVIASMIMPKPRRKP